MTEKLTKAIEQAATIDELTGLIASLILKSTATGRTRYVVTSKGTEVKAVFKAVDTASLVISNNLDGTVNLPFPEELQPRANFISIIAQIIDQVQQSQKLAGSEVFCVTCSLTSYVSPRTR